MTLEYSLTFSDFLEHQLYVSSQSELHKKKRKKNRIVVPIIYIVFAVLMYFIEFRMQAIAIVVIAVLWYLFYPVYSKWKYKNHYEKHIKEHYKHRIGKKVTLNFENDANFIEVSDSGTQTKINHSELDRLIELKDHYFLKLKSELSLIIPKRDVQDHEAFKNLMSNLHVDYVDELDWDWR